jgi:hypothetical protein
MTRKLLWDDGTSQKEFKQLSILRKQNFHYNSVVCLH